jgi:ligand-binding sensor domain-containing protein
MKKLFVLLLLCIFAGLWLQTEKTRGAEPEKLYVWQEHKKNPTIYNVAVGQTYIWGAYPEGVIRWHKEDHTYETYTFDSEVTAVQIAINNNVWVGTQDGLHRFDGFDWTHYTTSDGLPNNHITSLNTGPQGQLLVGAENGIVIFDGTQWTPIPTTAIGPSICFDYGDIISIAVDSQNRIWTSTGIASTCYYEQGVWKTFFQDHASVTSTEIEFHPNGDMWLAGIGNGSAGRLTADGEWITYDLPNNRSNSLTIDSAGNVWLGFELYGLSKFDGTSWLYVPGFQGGLVYDLESDDDGGVWTGSRQVSRFTNDSWEMYLAGIPGSHFNSVSTMHVAPNDDLWLGVYDLGVVQFDGEAWRHYLPPHASGTLSVDAIASDHEGNMWFGLSTDNPIFGPAGDGLVRFDGVNWQTFTTADGLANNWITGISIDNSNNVWTSHPSGGVSRKMASGFTIYTSPTIISDSVRTILAQDNMTWIGYWSNIPPLGLSGFDGTNWAHYGSSEGLSGNVLDFAVDPHNTPLVLTDSGVFLWSGANWSNLGISEAGLNTLTVDLDGDVWLVNYTGAFRFDGLQTYPITPDETGTSTLRHLVEANETGDTIWFRSSNGVVRLKIVTSIVEVFLPMVTK